MYTKVLVLIGILAIVLLSGCDDKKEKVAVIKEVPVAVNVHTLKEDTYPIWVDFSGKTQAVDQVMVISRVTGELGKSRFNPGDRVEKDQILFSIDKREYQAQWDQKNAILEKDQASLALAVANVKRYAPLVKEQLAPKEKLDELTATQKQLEATIRADKAALDAVTLDLEYCDVRASISGQIGKELVLTGNIVDKGTELATIVQTEFLYVNFYPSANEVALIKKYKSEDKPKVKVILKSKRGLDMTFDGEIDFIDNVSNTSTGTVSMRAKITNKDLLLFPGTFVELKLFVTDEMAVIAVHPDQIFQNQQGQYVYVLTKENTITLKQIKSGYTNNDLVMITQGLKAGEKVVVGTVNGLREGLKVTGTEVANPILSSTNK
ncbi:MAG: efflux RND transporter periplasmic adaptor subunit [Sulfurovum sp.]|nr:efflux RND transporter periplasmic adaptor subunit [Sulfurovum sp.]